MQIDNKFNVGDWVSTKQDIRSFQDKEFIGMKKPPAFYILEVYTVTCIAGTQIEYGVRGYNPNNGATNVMRFNEIELESASEE